MADEPRMDEKFSADDVRQLLRLTRQTNALAALAALPETVDQRRARLLAQRVAKLEADHRQLVLANEWLIQVVQHLVQTHLNGVPVEKEQMKNDWNDMAEAFRKLDEAGQIRSSGG